MFFSFDGIDGVGKTTQMQLFREWLTSLGHSVVACRDPGSTGLGEAVRTILLDRAELAIARRAEMLLYMAARAQLVDEVILPAIAQGQVVVSDRFLLANVVYQGYAGGLDIETLWQIGDVATAGLLPDVTFLLDMDSSTARQRINRPLDRMEQQGFDFQNKLRSGFLAEAKRRAEKIVVIDAAQTPEAVQAAIQTAALKVLSARA